MAKGKRVEIVKVPITCPDGTTVEVDGKVCTKCKGEPKPLTEFSPNIHRECGRQSHCRGCANRSSGERYRDREHMKGNVAKRLKRRTPEQYREEVKRKTKGEYSAVGDYTGYHTRIDHRHDFCGHIWPTTPCTFLTRKVTEIGYNGCPKCSLERRRKSQCEFKTWFKENMGPDYEQMEPYGINNKTPIMILHYSCGDSWPARPDQLIKGTRCPSCFGNKLKTNEQYLEDVRNLYGNEYCIAGVYRGNRVPIEHLHRICGHITLIQPHEFLSGNTKCEKCSESRGERRVREYLITNHYDFTPRVPYGDCRDIKPLPFDFVIHLRGYAVLIEYDGIQHFEPRDFGGKGEAHALEQFHGVQRRDRIKDDYCRANGIKLIRIKHTQFDDIEAILDCRLSALGITGKCPTEENVASAA